MMTVTELKGKLYQALDALNKVSDVGCGVHYLLITADDLDPESSDYDPKCGPRILFDFGLDLATRPADDAAAENSLPVTQTWLSHNALKLSVETNGCHMMQFNWMEIPQAAVPDEEDEWAQPAPDPDPEETDKPE